MSSSEEEGKAPQSGASKSGSTHKLAGGISAAALITLLTVFFSNGGVDLLKTIIASSQGNPPTGPVIAVDNGLSTAEIQGFIQQAAQLEAKAKAELANASVDEDNWNGIIQNWQQAIQLLEQIPASNQAYSITVERKLQEYNSQLLYAEALQLGSRATVLTKPAGQENKLSVEEWQKIEQIWEQAIHKLNTIPLEDPIYTAQVSEKLQEYKVKQNYAHQAGLAAPWLQGNRAAQQAAQLAAQAQSAQEWIQVSGLWQQAIELMQAVRRDYSEYDEAQQRISLYQNNLRISQRMQTTD